MAFDVKLPDLGDGIESGDVLEIYVTEGQSVTKEQGLVELETDKATVTVPSPRAGRISKILVAPGQSVPIGAVIVQLEAEEASSAAPSTADPAKSPASSPQTASPQPASPPQSAMPPKSATPPQPAAPTGPAAAGSTPAAPAPQFPVPSQAHTPAPARANVSVGVSMGSTLPPQSVGQAGDPSSQVNSATGVEGDMLVAASPSVRRFAREVGVDLSRVQGSGESGRLTREDVLRAVREASSRAASSLASSETSRSDQQATARKPGSAPSVSSGSDTSKSLPGTPGQNDYGPVRLERLSKIRKTIAAQMHKSWITAPQVTNFDDADVTELEAIRVSSKDDYAARGIKLTSMPFLLKAVATALRNHPLVNATLDLENEQIIYNDYVNLGVAVDTPRGLVVPNIRNAHVLSIPDIAKTLADIAQRVREGDFSVGELRGGTFTISNLGAIGGTYSTPIINVPEVAILLVGRTRKMPIVMSDDSIKVRQMMPLSLTYDHRLIDGGTAARFLNDVISLLENPSRLLLAIS